MRFGLFHGRPGRWALYIVVVCAWMSMGVLSDCDPELAGSVLSGVGSALADLSATFIEAFFKSITPETPTPVTTSMLLDTVVRVLA